VRVCLGWTRYKPTILLRRPQVPSFFTALKEADFQIQPTAGGASLKVVPAGTKMNLVTLYPDGKVVNFGCGDSAVEREYLDRLQSLLPNAQIRVASDNSWSSTVTRRMRLKVARAGSETESAERGKFRQRAYLPECFACCR